MASIRITMGGCQDFGVADIIRATGASGAGDRSRTFTIDGPMTVEQVAALMTLTGLDPQDDPVTIEFDPKTLDEVDYDDLAPGLEEWWAENVYGIEVFADHDDAQARADYIQKVTKGMPALTEYDYVAGDAVVRVSHLLTPAEAAQYKAAAARLG